MGIVSTSECFPASGPPRFYRWDLHTSGKLSPKSQ